MNFYDAMYLSFLIEVYNSDAFCSNQASSWQLWSSPVFVIAITTPYKAIGSWLITKYDLLLCIKVASTGVCYKISPLEGNQEFRGMTTESL